MLLSYSLSYAKIVNSHNNAPSLFFIFTHNNSIATIDFNQNKINDYSHTASIFETFNGKLLAHFPKAPNYEKVILDTLINNNPFKPSSLQTIQLLNNKTNIEPKVKPPTQPMDPSQTKPIKEPVPPKAPNEIPSAKRGVPLWVINKNKPEPNHVVTSGPNIKQAQENAIKLLTPQLRRNIIRTLAENNEIKNIQNNEIKKRILWQVAFNVAKNMEKHFYLKETWWNYDTNTVYLDVTYNDNPQNDLIKINLEKELKILEKEGAENYMKIEPHKDTAEPVIEN